MAPKAMSQAAIERLITQRVNAAVEAERARQGNARRQGGNANEAGGQGEAPAARECTFSGFMKCNPTVFHGHEGAVELSRWFEKTEMVFGISECTEARKVKFAAATLQGQEFCPVEEVQRMEHELWNLKVKEFDITAYTKRFHELVHLCPEMVPSERKKIEAYIRGLTDNIKGTVIGSKPISLNEAVRMAHALMEQKSQARIERIAEGNKRKWESSQGGNNRNNNRDNTRHNQLNNQRQGNARAMTTAPAEQGGYAGNKPLCNRLKAITVIAMWDTQGTIVRRKGIHKVKKLEDGLMPIELGILTSYGMDWLVIKMPLSYVVRTLMNFKVMPLSNQRSCGIHGSDESIVHAIPDKIRERIMMTYLSTPRKEGPVAYKLELLDKLRGIHNTFHVSNLKRCLADENLVIPLEEIQLDDKLHFIEEPVEIMDREVKQLKQSQIPIIKVRWNSNEVPDYTWEREDFSKERTRIFSR
ncbi:putative reverse transcriptase domain-containing protein [Tanacetum coccineum]|uniref:Reverse transcriptase domain-containing protein n=1 Tax=Tanacetum coccineum TaxID=301880 RepID=A0ABQ5BBF9_9ASTR